MPSPYASAAPAPIMSGTSQDQAAIGLLVQQIGSANWSQWQLVRYTFWDYVRFPNTGALTTSLQFFVNPNGSQDPTSALAKTLEQTNMVQAGQFGQNYFVIQQIRTHLYPLPKARQNATVAATTTFSYDQLLLAGQFRAVLSTGYLTFSIGSKLYFDIQQPFRTAPAGFGVSGVVVPWDFVVSPNANAYVSQSPSLDDVYNLTPPQLIEPSQNFQIALTFPDLGYNWFHLYDGAAQSANVDGGVILDGYLLRPMQ